MLSLPTVIFSAWSPWFGSWKRHSRHSSLPTLIESENGYCKMDVCKLSRFPKMIPVTTVAFHQQGKYSWRHDSTCVQESVKLVPFE